jgi:hypothetical protein
MDFAERLGLWFNAFDAISLQAAHQSIRSVKTVAPDPPSAARPTRARSNPSEDFQRLRTTLAHAIVQDLPHPLDDADPSYAPFQQRHLKLQRDMEQMIAALRDHVRQVLGRVSPGLRQLATLDAALEQVLAPREQMLLPTVGTLMQRRFEQLRLDHRQALAAAGQHDEPALGRQPGGWLEIFRNDWRQALLAELDLRLEPVAGLIEALSNELKKQQ